MQIQHQLICILTWLAAIVLVLTGFSFFARDNNNNGNNNSNNNNINNNEKVGKNSEQRSKSNKEEP